MLIWRLLLWLVEVLILIYSCRSDMFVVGIAGICVYSSRVEVDAISIECGGSVFGSFCSDSRDCYVFLPRKNSSRLTIVGKWFGRA